MTWRYIAQRALTGEFLHMDVPMTRDELTWALSGPGALRGTVTPDVGNLRAADGSPLFDEWGTLLYAEADGEIRWGGIVVKSTFSGPAWSIEAAGMSTYPHGLPYLDAYTRTSVDPLDVVREIWRHIQSDPSGGLGVVVDATTCPIRLGTTAEPYALNWWDARDCGGEIDTLAQEAPFDFVETHSWNADDTIGHRIQLGYPRLGTRRFDLAFVQGDNIATTVTADRDGADFANDVLGLGAGEGSKSLRASVRESDGRLRRMYVYSDKSVTTSARLTTLVRNELTARRQTLEFATVDVWDHPNAPIGSWQLGDDILIQADIPWLGQVSQWERVVGWSLVDEHRATLQLQRSDSFTYGGTSL